MTHPLRRSAALIAIVLAGALALFTLQGSARAASTQVLRLSASAHGMLMFSTMHLTAKPGKVTIEMANPASSGISHGIALTGKGVRKVGPIVAPGHTSSITVTVKRGTYTFYCPVPGHEQAGMKGTLTVR